MDFLVQFGIVLLLVFLNGYFVAAEFALVAIRSTRIDELAKQGNKRAKQLQKALKDLDQYISATQLGITLASLGLGWVGEPALAHFIEPLLFFLPETAAFVTAHSVSVVIAFTIITFLHIVLGELAPKSLALQHAESTAMVVITPLIWFTRIFAVFINLLNDSGQVVLKLVGIQPPKSHHGVHSEEEIRMLLRQSSRGGVIPSKEVEMVYNVFQLGDIPVKLIMLPKPEIVAFNITATLKDIIAKINTRPHSRFPVYQDTIDNIIGFVHVKDIYRELLKSGEDVPLSKVDIIRDILTVPEVKKIDAVLSDMRKKRIHVAIVNNEFGGTAGMITLEDVIESLVGEIEDEFDKPLKNIVKQDDGTYLIEGHTMIEDLQDKFHIQVKGQGYTTIGGLVFGLLGHEPRIGDMVQIGSTEMHVEEIDGKRVKLLRLKKETRKSGK